MWIVWQILISYSKFLTPRPLKWCRPGAHTIILSKNIHKITKTDYVWFEFLWIRRYVRIRIEFQKYFQPIVPYVRHDGLTLSWLLTFLRGRRRKKWSFKDEVKPQYILGQYALSFPYVVVHLFPFCLVRGGNQVSVALSNDP